MRSGTHSDIADEERAARTLALDALLDEGRVLVVVLRDKDRSPAHAVAVDHAA
jgi:hypothetical protein